MLAFDWHMPGFLEIVLVSSVSVSVRVRACVSIPKAIN